MIYSSLLKNNKFFKKYNEHILLVVSSVIFISFFYHCSKNNIYENLDVCPNCSSVSNSSDCNQCNNCGWCENNGTGTCKSGTSISPTTEPIYYGNSLGKHVIDDPIDYDANIPYIAAPDSCDTWTGPPSTGSGSVDSSLGSGSVDSSLDSGSVDSSLDSGSVDSSLGSGSVDSSLGSGSVDSSLGCINDISGSLDIVSLFDGNKCEKLLAGVDGSVDLSVAQATSCPAQPVQTVQNNTYPLQDLNINIINASDLGND
jgi:hypothetical protein